MGKNIDLGYETGEESMEKRKKKTVLRKWGRTHVTENQRRGHRICVKGMGVARGMGRRDGRKIKIHLI